MMDSFELNKIAGAILATSLLVLGLQNLAGVLYHSEKPATPGFEIAVADPESGAEEAGTPEAEAEPLADLLASASVEDGQSQARKCAACHTFEEGGPNRVGPNLYGIVGRDVASDEGFAYSDAMAAKGGTWTFDDLSAFLGDPRGWLPGTKMAFAGMKNPNQRADVLVYLRSLAADPVPLPEPAAAETPAPAGGEQPAPDQPAAPATEQPALPPSEDPQASAPEQPGAPASEQPAEQQPAEQPAEQPAAGQPAEPPAEQPANEQPAEQPQTPAENAQ